METEHLRALLSAIDEAVEFVRAYPDQMTRAEIDAFQRLGETAYVLARRAGLHSDDFPKVPELQSQLDSADLPSPAQFESAFNLPGDWDLPDAQGERLFLVCASPRWFQDMAKLRALAEAHSKPVEAGSQKPADFELHLQRLKLAKGDTRIIQIAMADWDADRKMDEIIREDNSTAGLDSTQWGTLLDVNPSRIRQTDTWKRLQAAKKARG